MRQTILVVVPHQASLFEVATPLGVWGRDHSELGGPAVELVVCGIDSTHVDTSVPSLTIAGLSPLAEHLERAHTIVVPTWPVGTVPVPDAFVQQLRTSHARGVRIVGLCLGAFAVAETGILDGLSAVTHWRYGREFERRFPDVEFEPDPLYLDHGSVVTSAGSAAALDCCLHLVRSDHGAGPAAVVARSMVTAPHRSGGQSQFAAAPRIEPPGDALGDVLAAATERIDQIRSVSDLARVALMSRRTLERVFRQQLGLTPHEWIVEQRVHTARRLLEETNLSIERVATEAGFGSTPTLRREIQRVLGTTPTAYRRAFGSPHP